MLDRTLGPRGTLANRMPPRSTRRATAWLATVIVASWIVTLAVAWGRRHAQTLDFYPLNGSFQTFNPVRRLIAGEWPARDFDAYLGWGPVYVTRLAMLPFGETFRDSVVGTYALCAILQALTITVLLRLARASWLVAACGGAAGVALAWGGVRGFLPEAIVSWFDRTTVQIAQPGNSLLGFRSLAPFVAIGIVALGSRVCGATRPGRWLAAAIVSGMALGVVATWSNDYGPITALATFVTSVAFVPASVVVGRRLAFAAVTATVGAVVAIGVLALATGGGVGAWFESNLRGVAADQHWYFFHGPGGGTWEVLSFWPFVVGAAATIVAVLEARRTRHLGDAALLLCVLATFGAAVLATRASTEERYFLPLYRVLWVALPVWTWRAVDAWRRRRASDPSTSSLISSSAPSLARGTAIGASVLVLAAMLVNATRLVYERDSREEERARFGLDAPELGGRLPPHFEKALRLGREIRAECERDGVPRDRRVVSTYTSILDLFADAVSPTRDDYVIHALGEAARTRWLDDVRRAEPRYVTTSRDDFSGWEGWVRKVNWPFYDWLVTWYDPVERTTYAVVWRRRTVARTPSDLPVELTRTEPDSLGRMRLEVSISDEHAARGTQIVEVELTSNAGFLPTVAGRWFTSSVLVGVDLQTSRTDGRFGIPAYATRWRFPVEVVPGVPTRLRLVSRHGDPLSIAGVSARVVIDEHAIDGFTLTRLFPSSRTDPPGLDRGILAEGDAGFVVTDATDLTGIAVGTRLRFAASGERRITRLDGVWVHVDGPALSPADDGYPHVVQVLGP